MNDPRRLAGMLLIALGAIWVVAHVTGAGAVIVVPAIGVAFLVAYYSTRRYGLLIPGGILTGLGVGLVLEEQARVSDATVLGLGLGFVAIAVVDVLSGERRGGWWWPLIPGGVLTLVGAAEIAAVRNAGTYVVPAVLIAVGVALIARRPRGAGGASEDVPAESGDEQS